MRRASVIARVAAFVGVWAVGAPAVIATASAAAETRAATTLAGQSLSSRTGQLTGTPSLTLVRPNAKGVYAVRVPTHAAAILTLSASGRLLPARPRSLSLRRPGASRADRRAGWQGCGSRCSCSEPMDL